MKKISANFIFPGNSSPVKNGVIVLDNNGTILDLLNPKKDNINWDEVEIYEGILCPGFINTHCHLELSYLKGQLNEKTQLHGFVKEIITIRNNFAEADRINSIISSELEMYNNGIVGVGDISNGNTTFNVKEKSKINYHTFIEAFGSDPKIAKESYQHALNLFNEYFNKKRASITPHATYSVSDNLVSLINEHCKSHNSIVSIHNQESASENSFYLNGEGELFDFLEIAKKHNHQFQPTGKNALPSFLGKFHNLNKILLIHNTFTSKEDIDWANSYSNNIYWCFCPNANLYIEDTLPDFNLFIDEKCTIGTDSLASNWSLSILDELKTISKNAPSIPLEILIRWSTYNGAMFLNFDKLGSFEKGKAPGVNLISNIDFDKMVLKANSLVKRLI